MNTYSTPYISKMDCILGKMRANGLRGIKLFVQSRCDDVMLDDCARDFTRLELFRQFSPALSSVEL